VQCWACRRQARGFRHTDVRHPVCDPRRYPVDWVFCSQRCMDAFHQLYGRWDAVRRGDLQPREVPMIDPSDVERAAMRKCLKAFGAAAEAIGFDKPLGRYTEAEALQVIDAIVTRFTEAMAEHHEATKYPPVRGLPPFPDPMAVPFGDMADDRPWEDVRA
jgi:hypothetical protein